MFLPTREHFYKVYSIVVVVLPVVLIDLSKVRKKWKQVSLLLGWSLFFLISTSFREIIINSSQFSRELLEISRILLFLPILLIRDVYTGRQARKILNFLIYCLIISNSFMVLSEMKFLPKSAIYYSLESTYHYKVQIGLSYLAKGMYSHGALQSLMMLMYSIYLTVSYHESCVKIFRLIIILLAIFGLFAGGSRTVMIGFAVYLLMYFGLGVFRKKQKPNKSLWAIPTISIAGLIYLVQAGYLVKLVRLLERGTNVSSVAGRYNNWSVFLDKINYYWYITPIGWGKTMFINKKSFFTDNDYFTYFLIHGLLVTSFLCGYILKETIKYSYKFRVSNSFEFCYLIMMCALIIVSTNSAGFSFPFALFMLILVKQISLSESYNLT